MSSIDDHIQEVFIIECSVCSNQGTAYTENIEDAGSAFDGEGWAMVGNRVYCPICNS